ncbi:Crp/Fnr family transcriptional regulator [bacterium]|nr:Crp/Fnr family transcriptional regulator [bacterium]
MLDIAFFENINNNEILELLKCIGIKTKKFKQNSYILKTGEKIDYLGVILEGNAQIIKNDFLNRERIIENLKIDDIFGHNIVCLGQNKSPVDVITKTNCEVLLLPFEKVITPCNKLCKYHLQLIKNVMKMISKRNSLLNDKLDIIGQKTTREKILALLENYKTEKGIFSIPYSREEMAKFLCIDRSAMSRELCKMRDEGILRFNKNHFEFL